MSGHEIPSDASEAFDNDPSLRKVVTAELLKRLGYIKGIVDRHVIRGEDWPDENKD